MNRIQAFLIHLGISLTIFGVLAYAVIAIWYPDFFFYTDGGWQGLRLLLGVDLVLGPLLTLIVYRAGKPGLRFDLAVIGAIQTACLAVGVWIVHGERPLAIAYVDGSFYSITAQSFRELDLPVPDLSRIPGKYPKWVKVAMPDDPEEQSVIREQMLRGGRMLATLSERYEPFDPSNDLDRTEARPLEEITDRDRDAQALRDFGDASVSNYEFFLFGARYAYAYLGFDTESNRFAGYLSTPAPGRAELPPRSR